MAGTGTRLQTLRLAWWYLTHPTQAQLARVVSHGLDCIKVLSAWLADDNLDTALGLAEAARRYALFIPTTRSGLERDDESRLWRRHGIDLQLLLRALQDLDEAARAMAATDAPKGPALVAAHSVAEHYARLVDAVDQDSLPS